MEAFSNEVNNLKIHNDTVKLSDLKLKQKYTIENMKTVKTKFGKSIVVTLVDGGNLVDVFLS